jgi:hypothetical protein
MLVIMLQFRAWRQDPLFVSAPGHFGIDRREAVSFEDADEQRMRARGVLAVVRNISGGDAGA